MHGQQVQPNFAMPLSPQFKYGYSNQQHPINNILFNNKPYTNIQPQPQGGQGLQMMSNVQQQIQMNYPQQQPLYNLQQGQQGQGQLSFSKTVVGGMLTAHQGPMVAPQQTTTQPTIDQSKTVPVTTNVH